MGFLRYSKIPPSTRSSTINATLYEVPFKSFLMNATQNYAPSGNPLPYVTVDNLPKNGTLGAYFGFGSPVPSYIVPNSSAGSNNGTRMVLYWEGSATVASGGAMSLAGAYSVAAGGDPDGLVQGNPIFNLNVSNHALHPTGGRVEFYFDPNPLTNVMFSFPAGTVFNNLAKLIVCRASDEASLLTAIASGDKIGFFTDEIRNVYKALKSNPFRPMGWSDPNDMNNVTQHRYRTPWQTGIGLCAGKWHPNCIAGSGGVISGTNTYTATGAIDTPGSLTDGEAIQGYFTNANTGASTFSRNGSTAKPIIDIRGAALVAGSIAAGSLGTLFFDSIMDAWCYSGICMTTNMPIELQVAFANDIDADLWYNLPPHTDAASVTQITTLVRDSLKPGLKARFELGNEIWNNQAGFEATSYYINMGIVLGFPGVGSYDQQYTSAYGLKIAQLFPLIKTAWSPRTLTELRRVLASQSAGDVVLIKLYRCWGGDLNTSLGYAGYNTKIGVNYNVKPNRPLDQCEDISYATYLSDGQVLQFPFSYQVFFDVGLNSNAFYAAADDYANGIATSNPALVNSALTWMDNHLRTGARSDWVSGPKGDLETLEGWRTVRHPRWETLANDLNADRPSGAGPVKIVNYEGGYGAQGPDAAACTHVGISTAYVAKCANLILAYKRSPLFYATSLLQLQECMAFSNYGAPSQFVVGTGPWSLRDGIDLYTPNVFGSWDATVYFNTH